MIRDIKFRGKRLDNGEWVYGFLFIVSDPIVGQFYWIKNMKGEYKVCKDSVGEFSGITSDKGDNIYEGQIVQCKGNRSMYGEVVFHNGAFKYIHRGRSNKDYNHGELISFYNGDRILSTGEFIELKSRDGILSD